MTVQDAGWTKGGVWSPDGVYLGLDTSGAVGSIALSQGGRILARGLLPDAREQASRILPAIESALREADLPRRGLSGVVLGAGPGSFTGVRVAAATAKGIAHALGVPLWAFSSLAAAALSCRPDALDQEGRGGRGGIPDPESGVDHEGALAPPQGAATCYVLFDARGDRVYAACFRTGTAAAGGLVEEVVPERATRVGDVLAGPVPEGAVFAGDGALRHREEIVGAGHRVLGPPAGVPTAESLLRLLEWDPRHPPIQDPARWEPNYLRASNAERALGT